MISPPSQDSFLKRLLLRSAHRNDRWMSFSVKLNILLYKRAKYPIESVMRLRA
jgi:hypothetical protein